MMIVVCNLETGEQKETWGKDEPTVTSLLKVVVSEIWVTNCPCWQRDRNC